MPFEKKILIVDDEDLMRQSTALILHSHGYDVADVPDGRAALHALQQTRYDLILLDLVMPGISGLDLLPKIHSLDPNVTVLIFAADVPANIHEAAVLLGAQGFIYKPAEPEEIVQKIQSFIR